jgi:peptidyl-prolyl cis-trans isomerase B (cyclophilin B)
LKSLLAVLAAVLALGLSPAYAQLDDTLVVLHTEQGMLVVELFPADAPNHAANFAALTEEGFYDDTLFHRIIPGFMIQGGDPNTKSDSGVSPDRWGTGGPDTLLAAEFNTIMHNRGIVSMARSASPDSAGSQFFIVHQDSNFLDTQYTVFGRLATQDSYDTLDAIAAVRTVESDRPADPGLVRVLTGETLTRDEAVSSGLELLDQGPPARTQPTEPPAPPSRQYESEELNLSVAFPEGWVIQAVGGEGLPDVVAVAPMMGSIPSSITVYVDMSNGTSLDEVIQGKVANLESLQATTQFEILSQERIEINGREMFVLDAKDLFETQIGLTQIKYREVTAVVGDSIYTFLFTGDANLFDADLPRFQETVSSFTVLVDTQTISPPSGGGCLIATAAFGSEMAPQVQQLRELRDGSLAHTEAGRGFLGWFNAVYYSFSPAVADYERENPVFRDMVRLAITPMISILSVLEHADMGTEAGAVLYGSAAILLVVLAYLGAPIMTLYWLVRMARRSSARMAPMPE